MCLAARPSITEKYKRNDRKSENIENHASTFSHEKKKLTFFENLKISKSENARIIDYGHFDEKILRARLFSMAFFVNLLIFENFLKRTADIL